MIVERDTINAKEGGKERQEEKKGARSDKYRCVMVMAVLVLAVVVAVLA